MHYVGQSELVAIVEYARGVEVVRWTMDANEVVMPVPRRTLRIGVPVR